MNIQVHTWIYGTYYTGLASDDRIIEAAKKTLDIHGKGTYEWVDGKRYDGEWKDDKQHGKWFVCKRIFIFVTLILKIYFNIFKPDWYEDDYSGKWLALIFHDLIRLSLLLQFF